MIFISALTPLILGLIFLSKSGIFPSHVFIPNSSWNDELFYYKQIESILSNGIPQGYYGYNESHALFGTFASWSPLLYLPYIMIGSIVGWNIYSPIICNLIFLSVSLVVLTIVLDPNESQLFWTISFLGGYAIISRYLFSVCPEVLIISLCILYFVFEFKYLQNAKTNSKWSLAANFIGILLTLMRGYYCLLLFMDLFYIVRNHCRKSAICYRIITLFAAPAAYVSILKYFSASYFIPLIKTEWILNMLTNPLFGIKSLFHEFVIGSKEEASYIINSLFMRESDGGAVGSWYLVFLIGLIWIIYTIIRTHDRNLSIVLSICIVLQLIMTVVYYPYQGSRHVIATGIVLMILLALMERSTILKSLLLILFVLITWFSSDSYTYSIPAESEPPLFSHTELKRLQTELSSKMILGDERWDNTVIWSISMDFHDLYALPQGFGINLCFDEYIIDNCQRIKSKYIAASRDSRVAELANDMSWIKIADYNNTMIWMIRE